MSASYSAMASDMGWPPGYHPQSIAFQGKTFELIHEEVEDGDVCFWEYAELEFRSGRLSVAELGSKITVFND